MSEIKFACPHCSQHIVCDDIYCGERIDCPGCERALFIPLPANFIPLKADNMTLELPVALKERRYPRSAGLDLWTEEKWEQHASEHGVIQKSRLLPLWILLLLPYFVAFILMMHRAGVASIECCFILSALAAGFYLAKIQNKSGMGMIWMGLLYSFAALFVYFILSFGLLFVGCLVVIL
jgi:hypothetical protein